jgi:peptidoglycan pentaglycine glycine transferase (the first glycine)
MTTVELCNTQDEWDDEILSRGGHPLQLWGWGATKASHGWRVERVMIRSGTLLLGMAQLLIRDVPKPFNALVYVPRGPVVGTTDRVAVLEALADYAASKHKAVTISIEPDWEDMPVIAGWRQSTSTILIPRTVILDLLKTEDDLLHAMSKKTRQYIRKSSGELIDIRQVRSREALDKCLAIYKQTAERNGFDLHSENYYHDVFTNLGDHSPVFAAYVEDTPVAFLWLAISRTTAFELYGGMTDTGQELRVNYALKWHAIQTMKRWGIERYDLNGLLNDGISTFKLGFVSHETMLAGTYDKPLSPLYPIWMRALPIAKRLLQKVKNR